MLLLFALLLGLVAKMLMDNFALLCNKQGRRVYIKNIHPSFLISAFSDNDRCATCNIYAPCFL